MTSSVAFHFIYPGRVSYGMWSSSFPASLSSQIDLRTPCSCLLSAGGIKGGLPCPLDFKSANVTSKSLQHCSFVVVVEH